MCTLISLGLNTLQQLPSTPVSLRLQHPATARQMWMLQQLPISLGLQQLGKQAESLFGPEHAVTAAEYTDLLGLATCCCNS